MSEQQIQNHDFDLERFVLAQRNIYSRALAEITRGRKTTHWMWFIFPQVTGLGNSEMSKKYAISGLSEARAYMKDPLLRARLLECAEALLSIEGRTAHEIFGSPDDIKLRSSMTLFDASGEYPIFAKVLDKYFSGERDIKTLQILNNLAANS